MRRNYSSIIGAKNTTNTVIIVEEDTIY